MYIPRQIFVVFSVLMLVACDNFDSGVRDQGTPTTVRKSSATILQSSSSTGLSSSSSQPILNTSSSFKLYKDFTQALTLRKGAVLRTRYLSELCLSDTCTTTASGSTGSGSWVSLSSEAFVGVGDTATLNTNFFKQIDIDGKAYFTMPQSSADSITNGDALRTQIRIARILNGTSPTVIQLADGVYRLGDNLGPYLGNLSLLGRGRTVTTLLFDGPFTTRNEVQKATLSTFSTANGFSLEKLTLKTASSVSLLDNASLTATDIHLRLGPASHIEGQNASLTLVQSEVFIDSMVHKAIILKGSSTLSSQDLLINAPPKQDTSSRVAVLAESCRWEMKQTSILGPSTKSTSLEIQASANVQSDFSEIYGIILNTGTGANIFRNTGLYGSIIGGNNLCIQSWNSSKSLGNTCAPL